MRYIVLIWLTAITFSCTNNSEQLFGTWKVVSKYYKGTYKIVKQNDSIKAKILYYNDDTTIIKASDKKDYYVFENLTVEKDTYVDAVSGATKAEDVLPNLSIIQIHRDTLEVTTYIHKKPLKELWVRCKSNSNEIIEKQNKD